MPTAPLIPKIPPLRTDIQEPQQSSAVNRPPAQGASNGANTASGGSSPQHRTSKEWYYYWSKIGERVVENTQKLNGLVTYGTHSARPDPSTMPDGAVYIESDRGAIYQNELIEGVPTWWYVAGTMWGTLSPDQRPTDLGVHDAGFTFRGTDQQREFIWNQAAWVETTPPQNNSVQHTFGSASLTLTTSAQPVPGATLTLGPAGTYLIIGVFYFVLYAPDATFYLAGATNFSPSKYAILMSSLAAGASMAATVSQQWLYTAPSAGATVYLQAFKTGGSGTSAVDGTGSSISATWISP